MQLSSPGSPPLVGKTSTHVKNTSHLVERAFEVADDPDDRLVSFDVVSLFASIPVSLAVATTTIGLENDDSLSSRTCLSVSQIAQLFQSCLQSTRFNQASGTALNGAAVSATATSLAMEKLKGPIWKISQKSPRSLHYMDNCFCIIKETTADNFLQQLHSIKPDIHPPCKKKHAAPYCSPTL